MGPIRGCSLDVLYWSPGDWKLYYNPKGRSTSIGHEALGLGALGDQELYYSSKGRSTSIGHEAFGTNSIFIYCARKMYPWRIGRDNPAIK